MSCTHTQTHTYTHTEAWFPRTSTGLGDHFPWKAKMKVSFWNDKVASLQCVPRKNAKDSERWFGTGIKMTQHRGPLDYEDITLISLVIRMIATICLIPPINDSVMPVCDFLSSQLFFTDLNSSWRCFRAWEFPSVPSWSYIIDLTDLVLPHSLNSFSEMICYQPFLIL